jgi:hypothetical protein
MLDEGEYAVWFKTPLGQGTGMIVLSGGRMIGQDSFFAYSGSYEQVGDRFDAAVKISRYRDGPSALFGVDEVELKLAGTLRGSTASCTGTAVQAPGVDFQATLIRTCDSAAPTIRRQLRAAPKFNPAALPKPKMR